MNRSIWILSGISENSIQMVSAPSVTKTMAEDVKGFESCVEDERIGSRFYIETLGNKNCQYAISLTV